MQPNNSANRAHYKLIDAMILCFTWMQYHNFTSYWQAIWVIKLSSFYDLLIKWIDTTQNLQLPNSVIAKMVIQEQNHN